MFGEFRVVKTCGTTNARVSTFRLSRNTLHLPVFMPVATYGAMRGVQPARLEEEIILSNTYHLRGLDRDIKEFMGWGRAMLTDSGGFQIQSLPDVRVVDEGVVFGGRLFTPEDSMDIQMRLGADIMMQLDDVVNPTMPRALHERAVARSVAWLDRAIVRINEAHADGDADGSVKRTRRADAAPPRIRCHGGQVVFPIIQGGLEDDLRARSIEEILARAPVGLAIGGLCGGEDKGDFCRTVYNCCRRLPPGMPRYVMGIGYPEDVVVCCALGTDMSDCVYPTRTARFGRAFCDSGDLAISNALLGDLRPISWDCACATCRRYSRAYLATVKGTPLFCMLMSTHNLHYMRHLTRRIRTHILDGTFPAFVVEYMRRRYGGGVPAWIVEALRLVGVELGAGPGGAE